MHKNRIEHLVSGEQIDRLEVTPACLSGETASSLPTLSSSLSPGQSSVLHRQHSHLLFPRMLLNGKEKPPLSVQEQTKPTKRNPMYIPGNGSKRTDSLPPAKKRRLVVHGAIGLLLVFLLLATSMIMFPEGSDEDRQSYGLFQPIISIMTARKSQALLIAAQVATATAVTQDGYDPGGSHRFADVPAMPVNGQVSVSDSSNLNRFFYGQCTYWANMRYHELTGHWVPWPGNAYEWAYEASAYGWAISTMPNPNGPSIIVLSPYAQGSGAYGHVAVVEKMNSDGSVVTSNWNWNGAWATPSWVTFYPGHGVSFVWFPG